MNRGDSRIAKILQESRIHQGLSQRELSQRSGLTQAQISRIENGEVDLRLSSLVALVNVLELKLILTPRTLGQPAITRQEKPPRGYPQASEENTCLPGFRRSAPTGPSWRYDR